MKATLPLKAASKTQQKHQQQPVIDTNTYTPGERNTESKKRSFLININLDKFRLGDIIWPSTHLGYHHRKGERYYYFFCGI